jgi:hypothetical protein
MRCRQLVPCRPVETRRSDEPHGDGAIQSSPEACRQPPIVPVEPIKIRVHVVKAVVVPWPMKQAKRGWGPQELVRLQRLLHVHLVCKGGIAFVVRPADCYSCGPRCDESHYSMPIHRQALGVRRVVQDAAEPPFPSHAAGRWAFAVVVGRGEMVRGTDWSPRAGAHHCSEACVECRGNQGLLPIPDWESRVGELRVRVWVRCVVVTRRRG